MAQNYSYAEDPDWEDVVPIPQSEPENALASINYPPAYSDAMSYLRAVMAANEYSDRALALTEHIITMNPAHYTVWLYRAKILEQLNSDLRAEIEYLNAIALRHIKNYQIWHHRQLIMTHLGDPTGEPDFLDEMFQKDAKNYHVWSYRQWLVRHFGLWNQRELDDVERLLRDDVRNNSAWNHRWFLVFGREGEVDEKGGKYEVSEEVWIREEEFAKEAVGLAPQNESAWNYLKGLYRKKGRDLAGLEDFARQYADVEGENVRSSHALDLLADVCAARPGGQDEARKALDLLAGKFDPIRVNYWNYKKSLLEGSEGAVAA